ncbi:hypothetical protein GCM10027563_30390 [Parasphingorhabdus pacifica]
MGRIEQVTRRMDSDGRPWAQVVVDGESQDVGPDEYRKRASEVIEGEEW